MNSVSAIRSPAGGFAKLLYLLLDVEQRDVNYN